MTLTGNPYPVSGGDVLLAGLGLAVALALAWISLDLAAGGRLTLAVTRTASAGLHAVPGGPGPDAEFERWGESGAPARP
jgi:hypothetical protein